MVSFTESAASHVRQQLAKRGSGIGMRFGVTKSGCTGFAYVVDYVDDESGISNDDHVFDSHGLKIVVDDSSLGSVNGTEIDYVVNNILNQGLEFRNPNIKDMCGCGESFSIQ